MSHGRQQRTNRKCFKLRSRCAASGIADGVCSAHASRQSGRHSSVHTLGHVRHRRQHHHMRALATRAMGACAERRVLFSIAIAKPSDLNQCLSLNQMALGP